MVKAFICVGVVALLIVVLHFLVRWAQKQIEREFENTEEHFNP